MIKNLIRKTVVWATKSEDINKYPSKSLEMHNPLGGPKLNLSIYSAVGGKIVRVSQFSSRLSAPIETLYIIPEGENLGNELGMIITREGLSE